MAERLIDQDARDRIRDGLDCNLVVLAGAGAGKTFALVQRMVEVIRAGVEQVEHLAAITFTRKAAGEMRGRFYLALRAAADTADDPDERARFREALSRVDQCFIGTIHAFCGRLLRERPLDARLPPDFQEADERTESLARREAWDRFVQARFSERDPRLTELDAVGLRTEDLYSFFERRCQFSDLPIRPTRTHSSNSSVELISGSQIRCVSHPIAFRRASSTPQISSITTGSGQTQTASIFSVDSASRTPPSYYESGPRTKPKPAPFAIRVSPTFGTGSSNPR